MNWKNILKARKPDYLDFDGDGDTDEDMLAAIETVEQVESVKKEESTILNALDSKEKKRLKKTLQASEPSEYFGQDFNKLGELIDMMEGFEMVKSDKKLTKKMKSINEQNVDMLATSSKLRKQYEQLYRQLRGIVYPKSKGTLRDEK